MRHLMRNDLGAAAGEVRADIDARSMLKTEDQLEGLTHRMHRFATLLVSGLSNAEAYRIAYDSADPKTVAAHASEMAHNPAVMRKVCELRARAENLSMLSAELSRNFVLNGLMGLALSAEKETVRLGAYQTLGKTVGIDLFRETVRHENVTRTVEDVEQDLKDKLEQLRQGLTIEGKAQSIEDQAKPRDRRRKPTK